MLWGVGCAVVLCGSLHRLCCDVLRCASHSPLHFAVEGIQVLPFKLEINVSPKSHTLPTACHLVLLGESVTCASHTTLVLSMLL